MGKGMDEVIEMAPVRDLRPVTFKKNMKVQPSMMAAIDELIKHPDVFVETPSAFFRIATRKVVRAGKVGLFKNKKSPTKEKSTFYISVKGWEKHFPKDPKIIKAIVLERIKEERKRLNIEHRTSNEKEIK